MADLHTPSWRAVLLRSLLVSAGTVTAALLGSLAVRLVGVPNPFLLFFAAVAISAWMGGWQPGLLATLLSMLCVWAFLLPSGATFRPATLAQLVAFILGASLLTLLSRLRRLARQHSQAERLVEAFSAMGDAVLATDHQGRIELLNPLAERLTGWPSAEARGLPGELVLRLANHATRQPVESPIGRVLRTGTVVRLDQPPLLLARDGSAHLIDPSAAPIYDAQARLRGALLVFHELADQQQRDPAGPLAQTQLTSLLERISDAFVALDRDWRYTYVNQAAALLLRKTPEDLLGNRLWELFPHAKHSAAYDYLHRAMERQEGVTFQLEVPELEAWFDVRVYPSADGLTIYYHDVGAQRRETERVRALQQVSAELSGALTAQQIGDIIINQGLRACGAAAGAVFLLEETTQTFDLLSYAGYPAQMAPRYRRLSPEQPGPLRDALHSGKLVVIESPAELVERWPNLRAAQQQSGDAATITVPLLIGQRCLGMLHLAFRVPRHFEPGDRAFLTTLGRQCSAALERARLYEAERQARERLSFLAEITATLAGALDPETMADLLAHLVVPRLADCSLIDLLDEHGEVRRVAAVHKDPAQAPLMRALLDHPPDQPRPNEIPYALRSDAALLISEVTPEFLAQAARSPAHLQLAQQLEPRSMLIVPLVARGNLLGGLSLSRMDPQRPFQPADLTLAEEVARRAALVMDNSRLYGAEQRARAQAEAAVQLRDIFLSVASHELKTPLTALLGQAQLLQRRLERSGGLAGRDQHTVDVIIEQARRLNQLIAALLDISRLEMGQLRIERTPLDLCALVRQVVAEFQPAFEQHTIDIQTPAQPLLIQGDRLRLEQVLQNLLQNAIKYSPGGGTVQVYLSKHGQRVCLSVRDQGIGIPTAALPQLFQRFYRAANASDQNIQGIGIGLYVVREIIALHGGTVEVESTEGVGSTFTICLPIEE